MNTEVMTQTAGAAAATAASTRKTAKAEKTNYGKTIGNPELSEKAQKYYEQLKRKYSNMDFILVSEDQKETAQMQAGKYANANRMVVLIDTEKVEKMAEDETYRKKYEGIIAGAAPQMAQLKAGLGTAAASVKTFGMKIDDSGNASFFAVIDQSLKAQKERIEQNTQKKAEAKKKAAKEAEEKRAEKQKEAKEAQTEHPKEGDTVMVTASTVEELLKKIQDTLYAAMSDRARTEGERKIGQKIDYSA